MMRRAAILSGAAVSTFLLVFAFACEARAAEAGTKVLVPADGPAALEAARQGWTCIARRGAYDVYLVPPARLNAFSSIEGVQARPDFDQILLHRGPIDTKSAAPAAASPPSAGGRLMLVQFSAPPTDADLELLAGQGARVVQYIPENAYLVWGDDAAGVALRNAAGTGGAVQFLGDYHPHYALSPRLDAASRDDAPVAVTVQFFNYGPGALADAERLAAAAAELISPPREALGGRYLNVRLAVPGAQLPEIAGLPGVVWVAPYVAPTLSCERQDQIVAGNLNAGLTQPSAPGYLAWLAGLGFPTTPSSYPIVDIVDDGFDNGSASSPANSEFRELNSGAQPSRVQYANIASGASGISSPNAVAGHGNINCSIVGGYNDGAGTPANEDSAGYNYGLGVSPYGRIASTKIFTDGGAWGYPTESTMVNAQFAAGTRISSNSWGASTSGDYDTDCQAYDGWTRDAQSGTAGHQQMLFVFAAGNDGPSSSTVGSPGTAKNVLCVGASENYNAIGTDGCGVTDTSANSAQDIVGFSSRGPCGDSRVKPDIVAPGSHIMGAASYDPAYDGTGVCTQYSPSGQTKYAESSGTSHSTPALAGCASLVYNFLGRVHSIGAPSPALLKGYLLHAGRHLTGVSAGDNLPSNSQGYGLVDLGLAFSEAAPRVMVDQTVVFGDPGQTHSVNGTIAAAAEPFRVALVWTDPPGATSGNAYVNNLDLQVTIDGVLYRGNNFSLGSSVSGGSADVRNNAECVFLPAGTTGNVTVTVVATGLGGDGVPGNADATDQDFALVVYNLAVGPTPTPTHTPTGPTPTPTQTPTPTPPPSVIWYEDFSDSNDGDTSRAGWWTASGYPWGHWCVQTVSGNRHFSGNRLANTCLWTSATIDLHLYADISISVDIAETGTMIGDDYIAGFYEIDGGSPTLFFVQYDDCGAAWINRSITGLNGDTLVIYLQALTTDADKTWRFDNVSVSGTLTGPTPTPTSTPTGSTPTPTLTPTFTPTITPTAMPTWAYLSNPSFEDDANLLPWTKVGTASMIVRSAAVACHGSYSCRFTDPTGVYDGRGIRSNLFAVTAGKQYNFSGSFYVAYAAGAIGDTRMRLRVEWRDAAQGIISLYPGTTGWSNSAFNVWETKSYASVTAPENAAYADLLIDCKEDVSNANSVYVDCVAFDEVPGTPTPTPSPTQTETPTPGPTPCAEALTIGNITNLEIATTRSSTDGGWFFYFGLASTPGVYPDCFGIVNDNSNDFTDGGIYTPQPVGLWVGRDSEDIAIEAGDYVTVTYDGGQTKNVYLPQITGGDDRNLYIGSDGSTYWDRDLCDLAQSSPIEALIQINYQPAGESVSPVFPYVDSGAPYSGHGWAHWGW